METEKREFKDEATDAWYIVGKIFLIIFAVAVIVFWIWGDRLTHGKGGCVIYTVFHVYCPGCGCTRAFYQLTRLHLWRSFLYNPFILVTVLMYGAFMVNTFLCTHTKKLGFTGFPVTKLVYASLFLLVGQCIIRNILLVGFGITTL